MERYFIMRASKRWRRSSVKSRASVLARHPIGVFVGGEFSTLHPLVRLRRASFQLSIVIVDFGWRILDLPSRFSLSIWCRCGGDPWMASRMLALLWRRTGRPRSVSLSIWCRRRGDPWMASRMLALLCRRRDDGGRGCPRSDCRRTVGRGRPIPEDARARTILLVDPFGLILRPEVHDAQRGFLRI